MPAILGIGTAAFVPDYGLGQAGAASADLLAAAVQRGITYIDTAAAYGAGEWKLGEMAARLEEHRVRVATKIEAGPGGARADTLVAAVRGSLERLRCGRVDTILLHSAKLADLRSPEVAATFGAVKRDGLAVRAGASTYGVEAASVALDAAWSDAVQVEHSLLNQQVVRAVAGRKRPGQELIVRSVLCKGLLTPRRMVAGALPQSVAACVGGLERVADEMRCSLPELAIRFALDTPGVDVVLVGVASVVELETALAAAKRPPLTRDQIGATAAFDCSREDCVHPERWQSGNLRSRQSA